MRIQVDVLIPATYVYETECNDVAQMISMIRNQELKPVDKIYDDYSMILQAAFLMENYGTTSTEIDL